MQNGGRHHIVQVGLAVSCLHLRCLARASSLRLQHACATVYEFAIRRSPSSGWAATSETPSKRKRVLRVAHYSLRLSYPRKRDVVSSYLLPSLLLSPSCAQVLFTLRAVIGRSPSSLTVPALKVRGVCVAWSARFPMILHKRVLGI